MSRQPGRVQFAVETAENGPRTGRLWRRPTPRWRRPGARPHRRGRRRAAAPPWPSHSDGVRRACAARRDADAGHQVSCRGVVASLAGVVSLFAPPSSPCAVRLTPRRDRTLRPCQAPRAWCTRPSARPGRREGRAFAGRPPSPRLNRRSRRCCGVRTAVDLGRGFAAAYEGMAPRRLGSRHKVGFIKDWAVE